jgi:hypothetical protein
MAVTYNPIATTTLGSAQTTIQFTSIPSTYTDLKLVLTGNISASGVDIRLQYNSDTGTNYSYTDLAGYGGSVFSSRSTNKTFIATNFLSFYSGSDTCTVTYDIMNYANTSMYKSTLERFSTAQSDGNGGVDQGVGLWRSTAAISSLSLSFATVTFSTGTTATLYGIQAA